MRQETCPYCNHEFRPSRYRPDQKVCSSQECQRRRAAEYRRKKLAEDPVCRNSRHNRRENNPGYIKRYLAGRRSDAKRNRLESELSRLQGMIRSNSAVFDLKSCDASIWLVGPRQLLESNILAHAQLIIV